MVDKALMGEGLTPPKGQGLGRQPLQQEEGQAYTGSVRALAGGDQASNGGGLQSGWKRPRARAGSSGLTAAATAPSAAASLHPYKASLLLQDADTHHLGQLLGMAPGVGRHLHPGTRQSPEPLFCAPALAEQL